MKFVIETIPHNQQRYPTTGDYWTDPDGTNRIVVSDMGNDDYPFLVALHELVEQYLTQKRGITEKSICDFDIAFEEKGEGGDATNQEPGDEPDAPYQNEHCFATGVERLMCAALGVKWRDYDDACAALYERAPT